MSARHGSLARWLAGHLRCSVAEADERLQASRRAAFRLTASDAEWQADDDYRDADVARTGVRAVVDARDVRRTGGATAGDALLRVEVAAFVALLENA